MIDFKILGQNDRGYTILENPDTDLVNKIKEVKLDLTTN